MADAHLRSYSIIVCNTEQIVPVSRRPGNLAQNEEIQKAEISLRELGR